MKQFELDKELVEKLQAKSIELAGLERLIGFSMSVTDYEISEEKLEKLIKRHRETNAEYEKLKEEVNKIVNNKYGDGVTWNLDFFSRIVTIKG